MKHHLKVVFPQIALSSLDICGVVVKSIESHESKRYFTLYILSLIFLIVSGVVFSELLASYGENRERYNLIQLTDTATSTFSPSEIAKLRAVPEEAKSERYNGLKKQIEYLHKRIPDAGFIYIMQQHEDSVVFLLDSEPSGSEDAVLPGEVFENPSPEFLSVFTKGDSITEGPIKDKWGVWVSGHSAIRNPISQEIIAVLGVDIRANKWRQTIMTYRFFGYGLTGSLIFLILIFTVYNRKIKNANLATLKEIKERTKAENEVAQLRGMLPICSSCKKIRDDKGYWNQVEHYISEHADVSFSHGYCPHCFDKEMARLDKLDA